MSTSRKSRTRNSTNKEEISNEGILSVLEKSLIMPIVTTKLRQSNSDDDNEEIEEEEEEEDNMKCQSDENLIDINIQLSLKSDSEELFDEIIIPNVDIDSISLDKKGNIIDIDNFIKINEDALLKSLKTIKLTSEEEKEIKKQVNNSLIDDDETLLPNTTADKINKSYQDKETNIEREIKQKNEEINIISDSIKLFEELKKLNLEQEIANIKKLEQENHEKLDQINKVNQEISKIEKAIDKLRCFESNETVSSITDHFNDTEKQMKETLKIDQDSLLKGIQSIFNLSTHLNVFLINRGQPPIEGCNVKEKSLNEISDLLKQIIQKVDSATKTIVPKK